MTHAQSDPHLSEPAPFILEHRKLSPRTDGGFTPEAIVAVPSELRGSGLVKALDPEDLQTLVVVLSSVTPNGGFIASPETIGAALGVGAEAALARLRRLSSVVWRDGPLLFEQRNESGLTLFVPSAHLFSVRQVEVAPPGGLTRPAEALPNHRNIVLSHSRAAYGRPRLEVEAEIERFLLGEEDPKTPEEAARFALRRRLLGSGLTREQADRLLDGHGAEAIERQLEWLSHRHARNPAGYLIAAVEGDYEAPPALRRSVELLPESTPVDSSASIEAPASQPLPEVGSAIDLDLP